MEVKNQRYGRVGDYAERVRRALRAGHRGRGHVPVDIALPCATQNELDADDAAHAGDATASAASPRARTCRPRSDGGATLRRTAGVLFAPGKAGNAGGVADLGPGDEPERDARSPGRATRSTAGCAASWRHPRRAACATADATTAPVNYVDGANIAGFVKVADAMLAQGVI